MYKRKAGRPDPPAPSRLPNPLRQWHSAELTENWSLLKTPKKEQAHVMRVSWDVKVQGGVSQA